jgi:GT2 family glycosyltransferase
MISAVIPGCNLGEMAAQCIQDLQSHSPEVRVIYVDNGSDAKELEIIRAELRPNDKAVELGRNTGWTYATAVGIEATDPESDLLLLNNDAFVGPGTVRTLAECLRLHPKLAAVNPLTDGPGMCNYARGTRAQRFAAAIAAASVEEKCAILAGICPVVTVAPTPMVPFFCTLIRREAMVDVGGFDLDFKDGLGGDDDWCLRARNKGWQMGICPAAFCSHLGATSFRALKIMRNCSAAYRKLRNKHGRTQ